ncbi:CidA/LrgA family protein [Deferribacter autotrophicus]|uniref:CidA/LrgA family protein n=1 Tax=Deferribacter autotrophicus TaxID=500465 RepID=A0A5A8F5A3_9BACT|nr:CidA/LrgA family protein [Deferribacter autotrophicus]KAA0257027.1 CidA/LrgA family protein [Deferribacter autotrophicus]
MIQGLTIIFLFLFIGDTISNLFKIPIPGNVIGMILLTGALKFEIIKLKNVKPAADILVKNMAFLFIPPGVGIMIYFDLIKKELIPIIVSYFFSTLAVLFVVGKIQQALDKKNEKSN